MKKSASTGVANIVATTATNILVFMTVSLQIFVLWAKNAP